MKPQTIRTRNRGRTLPALLGLLVLATPTAQAQFSYTTNADGLTLTITGYAGSVGPVIIPTNINGLRVVNIRNGAFQGSNYLGGLAFPNYVPTSVAIPSSVTNIGADAFFYCTSLTNATIGSGVTSIGVQAFYYCTNLASIAIPGSVTTIGQQAFTDCANLTNATIATGVTSIGAFAFSDCTNLSRVTIPSSVTGIGISPFADCTKITAFAVDAGNAIYSSVDGVLFGANQGTLVEYPGGKVGGYAVPGSVTSIADNAFFQCPSLTSITIRDSVTSIGFYAFGFCTGLTNAAIANGVSIIGDEAFYWSGLTSVRIPNSVTSIGFQAFSECSNLAGVTIPDSVTSIGDSAFSSCASLGRVTIPRSVTNIGDQAFAGDGRLTSVYFKGNAPAVGFDAFWSDSSTTVYYLPGTTGWGEFSAGSGLPAVLWNPLIQAGGAGFGISSNQFGFNLTGTPNIPIAVEACTNLASPVWIRLQTLMLTNGLFHFSEPVETNIWGRYYRISSP